MLYIYILTLKQDKYYVGKTNKLKNRINEHFNNHGSFWTMKYKPIKIKQILEDCDIYDEDKYTIMMMAKYGIENVRGGSFTRINLNAEELNIIAKMINSANDKCFKCFMDSHFCNDCPYDPIKNYDMITLKYVIIGCCLKFDLNNKGQIKIKELKKALIEADNIIFNGITNLDVYKWSKIINKSNIKGIQLIEIVIPVNNKLKHKNIYIDYKNFSYGIIVLLDRQLNNI